MTRRAFLPVTAAVLIALLAGQMTTAAMTRHAAASIAAQNEDH